jgi:HD-GYP domain-containing protein (c-di-GMP phosphodiesterase class II)
MAKKAAGTTRKTKASSARRTTKKKKKTTSGRKTAAKKKTTRKKSVARKKKATKKKPATSEPELPVIEAATQGVENTWPADPYDDAYRVTAALFELASRKGGDGDDPMRAVAEIERVAGRLVDALDDYDMIVGRALGDYSVGGDFIVQHSVNVAALVLPVARELRYDDQQLETLCSASLMHDLGTVRIPDEIMLKAGELTEEEWQQMRQRPTHSREMLRQLGDAYLIHAQIAHQVYERADGSGYPEGLPEAKIIPEACLVGAVDFFEACAHDRPYKTATDGIRSLVEGKALFGSKIVRAIVNTLGFYPVGSVVELCNGEIACVVAGNKAMPSQPVVEIRFDAAKRRLEQPRRMDLRQAWQVYVVRPLSEGALARLNIDIT